MQPFKCMFTLGGLLAISTCFAKPATPSLPHANDEGHVYAALTPLHQAELASELDGIITAIHSKVGDHFKQGSVLLEFDCKPIELEILQVKALLKGSQAHLDSNRQLAKLSSISHLEMKVSESEHEKNLAKLESLLYQQQKCQLKAPFSGEVISQQVNPHEAVKANDPLMSILSNEMLEVQMFVPSTWLSQLKVGTPFKLHLNEFKNSHPFKGYVSKIVGNIDPASQSILIYGTLNNKAVQGKQLYAGMSGDAQFEFKKTVSGQ